MKQDSTIDCIIIGHHDLKFSSGLEEAKISQFHSGAYWTLTAMSVEYSGRKIPYDVLLNNYLTQKTGRESDLHVYKTPSLGVCYLYNYLKKRNFNVEYVNFFTHEKERLASLLKCNPRSVAITTTYYTSDSPITDIVRFIRQHNQDTKIIVGGPHIFKSCSHVSQKRQDVSFREIGADVYVNDSQGEFTLSRIVSALKQTASPDFSSIPNVIFSKGTSLYRTEREPEQNSLDENAIDWRYFDRSFLRHYVPVRTARSCAYKCSFCNFPTMAGALNLTSLDVVEKELSRLHDAGVTRIFFVDDTFNIPLPRFKQICRVMIERKFRFEWYSYFRCTNADDETFDLMQESGCAGVLLGIESGDQTILNNMNKKVTVEKYKKGIQKLNERHIITSASFIIGFPGETRETALNTRNFIEETAPTLYNLNLYYHDRKTPIHEQAEAFDLVGNGYGWRHRTMDWREACGLIEMMHRSITRSVFAPTNVFSLTTIPYLRSHGMSVNEITQFLEYAKGLLLQELKPPIEMHDYSFEPLEDPTQHYAETLVTIQ